MAATSRINAGDVPVGRQENRQGHEEEDGGTGPKMNRAGGAEEVALAIRL